MKQYQALLLAGLGLSLTAIYTPLYSLHPHAVVGLGLMISGAIHWRFSRAK